MQNRSPASGTLDRPAESSRSVFRNPYVWAFFAGIVLMTLIRPMLRHEPAPPAVLGQLPSFTLTADDGRPFGSAELAGRPYVANFIFTRCPTICPKLTAAMARLQQRYDEAEVDDVRLVSISVDPDYDTPERLHEYARAHGADFERWTLLTGDSAEIRRLVIEGFRTPLGEPDPDRNLVEIAHSTRFVLVDGSGRVRGYYDNDEQGLDEVFHRSKHVLRETGG